MAFLHNPYALINVVAFYYRFDVEVYAEFPGRVAISMCETYANVWELMGKCGSCAQFIKSHIFYCK